MTAWSLLNEIVLLLGTALLLGMLAERLKQNAVIGYLLTGLLLGPAALDWLHNVEDLRVLAELGVALLLFTIGLEFSWRRLRELGPVAMGGGALQILLTGLSTGALAMAAGLEAGEAVVVAAAVSLSSTAVVLRVLATRTEMDSMHGRNALGILLLQDIAVVPLVLLISATAERKAGWSAVADLGLNVGKGFLLVGALFLLTRYLLPRMLSQASAYRNRDLPAILTIAFSVGCAGASHALGLSPALGAFVAGMLLAESPFSQQIQADIIPLRAGFVTLFFALVGTMAVLPAGRNLVIVGALVSAILLGKTLIAALVVLLFRQPARTAAATGLALAQIGEFSFVLAELGLQNGLLSPQNFQLLVSASLITLLLTPYLIGAAPKLTRFIPSRAAAVAGSEKIEEHRVVIVGFGPAGQGAAEVLRAAGVPYLVIDLNPRTVEASRSRVPITLGDATRSEVLGHARLERAAALLVTIPDPQAAGLIVSQARRMAPQLPIAARGRYHLHASKLAEAGADHFVDEEFLVGEKLGMELMAMLRRGSERRPDAAKATEGA